MANKKIKKETFKLWIQVERHIEYEDGTDKFEDVEDATASAGEFNKLEDAIEHMEEVSAQNIHFKI